MGKRLLLIAGIACSVALLSAANASAAVRTCRGYSTSEGPLNNATITSVRNVSCFDALRVVSHGPMHNGAFGRRGSQFRLSPWRCTVTFHDYELWLARCTWRNKAFRVNYGF